MSELLYIVAFVLLGAGSSIGHKLDSGHIVDRPLNPLPLRVVSGVASIAGIGWFIYGFFPFAWWLPLLAVVAFAVLGAFIIVPGIRSGHGPVVAMLSSILGVAAAAVVLTIGA